MSSNKRQVTEYEVLTNEPIYFASGIKGPASSGTPSAGAIARNATTGAIEVAGVSDSTYHSVCLRPALEKTFASVSVPDTTSVTLDFSSSVNYQKRVTTTTLGSFPAVVVGATDNGNGNALVSVSGEWSANNAGYRQLLVGPLNASGTVAGSEIYFSTISPQTSGITEHSTTVYLPLIDSTNPIAGIVVSLLQTSGSTLTFDNVRVSFVAI